MPDELHFRWIQDFVFYKHMNTICKHTGKDYTKETQGIFLNSAKIPATKSPGCN